MDVFDNCSRRSKRRRRVVNGTAMALMLLFSCLVRMPFPLILLYEYGDGCDHGDLSMKMMNKSMVAGLCSEDDD
ncbi:hypothetical protein TSUD_316000 [Trifolium subterraneum]|uniref:Transmembrane protein n=1 Tax=Trifolium subterraneum TaxID=3900 RepID=A0A2Z6N5F7_TRISU|nr:hypothetical protein TSUD_316000 [Trifolium subterraneum]